MAQRLGVVFNQEPEVGHTNIVTSVAISADGQTIVSGSGCRTIIVWQKNEAGTEWQMAQRLEVDRGLDPDASSNSSQSPLALSANGKMIVSRYDNKTVAAWQKDRDGTYKIIFRGKLSTRIFNNPMARHLRSVSSIALGDDGKMIVSGSYDQTIIVWRKESVRDYCLEIEREIESS